MSDRAQMQERIRDLEAEIEHLREKSIELTKALRNGGADVDVRIVNDAELLAQRDRLLAEVERLREMIPPKPPDGERLIWLLTRKVAEPFTFIDEAACEQE